MRVSYSLYFSLLFVVIVIVIILVIDIIFVIIIVFIIFIIIVIIYICYYCCYRMFFALFRYISFSFPKDLPSHGGKRKKSSLPGTLSTCRGFFQGLGGGPILGFIS